MRERERERGGICREMDAVSALSQTARNERQRRTTRRRYQTKTQTNLRAQMKFILMRRNTALLRCSATTTSLRSDRTSTMSAASTATYRGKKTRGVRPEPSSSSCDPTAKKTMRQTMAFTKKTRRRLRGWTDGENCGIRCFFPPIVGPRKGEPQPQKPERTRTVHRGKASPPLFDVGHRQGSAPFHPLNRPTDRPTSPHEKRKNNQRGGGEAVGRFKKIGT